MHTHTHTRNAGTGHACTHALHACTHAATAHSHAQALHASPLRHVAACVACLLVTLQCCMLHFRRTTTCHAHATCVPAQAAKLPHVKIHTHTSFLSPTVHCGPCQHSHAAYAMKTASASGRFRAQFGAADAYGYLAWTGHGKAAGREPGPAPAVSSRAPASRSKQSLLPPSSQRHVLKISPTREKLR